MPDDMIQKSSFAPPDPLAGIGQQPQPPIRVLLVEDEPGLATALAGYLEQAGMQMRLAGSIGEALPRLAEARTDIVLLDLHLPDGHGISLLQQLRAQPHLGVLVLSGCAEEAERVAAIEVGADDYLVKPLPLRELAARIRAVHRRVAARPGAPGGQGEHRLGPLLLRRASRSVLDAAGSPVPLTGGEFHLLDLLVQAGDRPLPREAIFREVLRRPWRPEDRSADQLVFTLRRKLDQAAGGVVRVYSERLVGYRLVVDEG
jgi:two-component system, OmpR family, response regulator